MGELQLVGEVLAVTGGRTAVPDHSPQTVQQETG